MTLDFREARTDGVITTGSPACHFLPHGVRTRIDELQGSADSKVSEQLAPRTGIDRNVEPLIDSDAVVMSTFRANVEVALDLFAKRDFLAFGAFDPDIVAGI